MKALLYNGQAFIVMAPAKSLFKSSLIYEVTTRGDVFAMNIKTQVFTVIPGDADVRYFEIEIKEILSHKDSSPTPL